MPHDEPTRDGVLRFPRKSSSSNSGLREAIANAEAQFVRHERALAESKARVAQCNQKLNELNHRFANSLQIVSSFLCTASRRARHGEAKTELDAAAIRIRAMARVHRLLAEHEKDERLDLYRFLNDLAPELEEGTGLRCDVDGESVTVSGDVGFRLGTAVTELVLNARKHAYAGHEGGRVCIKCNRMGGSQLCISVSDRGKGLPEDFEPGKARGIGMSVIIAAAKHLNGQFHVRNADGASFTLIVPIEQVF